jgi:uncharacterized damage-inducible protein DinB
LEAGVNLQRHLRRLFSYDEWANREILKVLSTERPAPQRSLKLLAHIIAAEWVWLDRLESRPQSIAVWPDLTLEECRHHTDQLPRLWRSYLDSLSAEQLSSLVAYTNSKGEVWKSAVEDILVHVTTHSAYHRGQIAVDLRAAGLQPAYTDYIHAVRQGLVE